MRLEMLTQTLLLGAVLGVAPLKAVCAPTERSGATGASVESTSQKVSQVQKPRTSGQVQVKDGKGALAGKSAEAEEAVPEKLPPAEPQSIALRGVRG